MNMTNKFLIVVDVQNDFVRGTLSCEGAETIIPHIVNTVERYKQIGYEVIFTQDSHGENYLHTKEGRYLPITHCIKGNWGWEIVRELQPLVMDCTIFEKSYFASPHIASLLQQQSSEEPMEIVLCGFCTDICILANAVLLSSLFPHCHIKVIASACGGSTAEAHQKALAIMKGLHVEII